MSDSKARTDDGLGALRDWCRRVEETTAAAEALAETMRDLERKAAPPGGDPGGRVAVLMELWRSLGITDAPGRLDARAHAFKVRVASRTNDADRRFAGVLWGLNRAVREGLDAGGQDPITPLIRTADFGKAALVATLRANAHRALDGTFLSGYEQTLVVAPYNVLPADHPLRQELAAADCYDGAALHYGPLVVLGPPCGGTTQLWPEDFYDAAGAVRLTKEWRGYQLQQIRLKEEARRAELEEQQRRRDEDPANRASKLEKQVAELRRELAEVKAKGAA